jgi:hypothetical protein
MSTKLLKKEAGDIKRRPGNSRTVATVNQSYISNVINYGFKIANQLASGAVTPTSGGSIPTSAPINLATLAILGETQAARLLGKNPELANTNNVMLPSGTIYSRPTSELTVAQARSLVARDIAIGRKPNEYEYGLANGDVLTRDQQYAAQRALHRDVGAKMVLADTFDAIPPPSQDLLRRAAGVIPTSTKVDVQLKAKVITPPSSGGGSGGGGGSGKGWLGGRRTHSDWKSILNRVTGSDSAKKTKIYEAFNTTEPGKRSDLETKLKGLGIPSSDVSELIDKLKFE